MDIIQKKIIDLKQYISKNEPYSVGNEGKGDFVFLMKEPGIDAFVYDTGVYFIRMGFGSRKELRQQANFIKALSRLREEGYRPYPYFRPGFRGLYERRHLEAKEKTQESITFFPSYEKITPKQIIRSRLNYDQAPILQQPIIYRQQPVVYQTKQTTEKTDADYQNLFKHIEMVGMEIGQPQIRARTKIQTPDTFKILTPSEYYNWTRKLNLGVIGREMSLGLRKPIKIDMSKEKDKLKKNKKDKKGEDNE